MNRVNSRNDLLSYDNIRNIVKSYYYYYYYPLIVRGNDILGYVSSYSVIHSPFQLYSWYLIARFNLKFYTNTYINMHLIKTKKKQQAYFHIHSCLFPVNHVRGLALWGPEFPGQLEHWKEGERQKKNGKPEWSSFPTEFGRVTWI